MTDRPIPPSEQPRPLPPEGVPIGRAAFLGTVALGIAGIAVASRTGNALDPTALAERALPQSLVQSIVPTHGWRIYTVSSPMPRFDPATYALRIDGLVERPVTLTWSEVAALPGADQVSVFHCVTGWTVRGVHWEGIRATTIADLVRPLPTARYVTAVSMERPYVDQITMQQWQLADTMLARKMDGVPLKRSHGAPLRMVIPRMYGYKGVKWVQHLRFDAQPSAGYWEQRGYDVDAWIGHSNGFGA